MDVNKEIEKAQEAFGWMWLGGTTFLTLGVGLVTWSFGWALITAGSMCLIMVLAGLRK